MKKFFFKKNTLLLLAMLFSVFYKPVNASHYLDSQIRGKSQLLADLNQKPATPETFHLYSHGKPAQLFLNGHWLKKEQLAKVLQKKLSIDPGIFQINIYGCEFAKGAEGKAAVAYLEKVLHVGIAASDDLTGRDGDWDLEVGSAHQTITTPAFYPYNLQYGASDDFDGDSIINSVDLDDDNDGILDTEESAVSAPVCDLHYPNLATTTIASSDTQFPAGRELANTYDNNPGSYGGSSAGTGALVGTVTYLYDVPLNNVTEFQFFSNGGGVLTDGQVTFIASVKFFDSRNNLLYQKDNVTIPQASISTPYVLSFDTPLRDVASFSLTDLSDNSDRTASKEAIWKEVNLMTCAVPQIDIDTDQDGIANRFDLDSDGDGCPDAQEAQVVTSFPIIPFASVEVTNTQGPVPALFSQISSTVLRDQNKNGFDDRLETVTAGSYAGIYDYKKATNNAEAACIQSLDSDKDGIADALDLDDDNDGILDTEESAPASCAVHHPDMASYNITPSSTAFPADRPLENTYDNNLGTFGGAAQNTPTLPGTVTYQYNTPLNNVTEFQFFSNGGGVLNDGQVTNIASARFLDSEGNILYQQNNLVIPQASISTPYVLAFPQALQGVSSFTLTDLTDQTHGGFSEAIWKEVNLKTCDAAQDLDTDGDGIVNRLDLDSDGDGCPDSQESAVVASFASVQFANADVINAGSTKPALNSQVASASFQDLNLNGFEDRFETQTEGIYTGIYTYNLALDPASAVCTPLPVTLISFTGQTSAEGNVLQWQTTQENGFDRFSIEKSLDPSKSFTPVGQVKGGMTHYKFTDMSTAKGNSYYRLKMIDLDGSLAYSRIISVYKPFGENEHIIFPNPSTNHRFYIYNYFEISSIRVYDIAGNLVKVKTIKHADRYQFDVNPNAAPGLYLLEYRVGQDLIRRKFSLN